MPVEVDTSGDQGMDADDTAAFADLEHPASAATNVNGPASSSRRVRNSSTWASSSLAITETCDLLSVVIPGLWTSLSIRRVDTPSR